MEIYRYDYTTKEWNDIRNSNLKSKERDAAFDDYIKSKGKKVTLVEYFQDGNRDSFDLNCDRGYSYKAFGEPENCLERLAKEEIDYDTDLLYCSMHKKFPEDLCECRTDWDQMKSYADGLYYFIESLKGEIASGKVKVG